MPPPRQRNATERQAPSAAPSPSPPRAPSLLAAERRAVRLDAWRAIRALRARAAAEHHDAMALLRAAVAELRAIAPAARRSRWRVARAAARPQARPPRAERPRCCARCRDGHPCSAAVVWRAGEDAPRRRCRIHGGASTGPRTVEGKRRALQNLRNARRPSPAAELRLEAPEGCPACVLAARRGRGVVQWFTRQVRAAGVLTRWVLGRALRWSRCAEHARRQLARWDREGAGVRVTVSFSVPCA